MNFLNKKTPQPSADELQNKYNRLRDKEQSGMLDSAGRAELHQLRTSITTDEEE